jgi:hypothetical protein
MFANKRREDICHDQKMNHLWISEAAKLAGRSDGGMPTELVSALTAIPSQGVAATAAL